MSEENFILHAIDIRKMNNVAEFEYAVQMTRWLLKPLGIWPLKSSSYLTIALRYLAIGGCSFLLAFLMVPFCLQMFLVEKDLGVQLRMIGPLSFCLMNIFKYFAMLVKKSAVATCILDIARDWHEVIGAEERSLMLENVRTARYFITISALFMYGGGMPYCTFLPLIQEGFVVGNVTYRNLAYPSYFIFFNPHIRPVYDVVLLIHSLCGFVLYSSTCGVCSFAILCVMHICSQCSITSMSLRSLASNLSNKTFEKIVRQHLRSLRFASKLENILNDVYLVEMMGCTFNICMLGYYFITGFKNSETVGSITYFLLLVSFIFNIFIICYIGELLTEKCQSVGEVAYMINWYRFSSKDARNIILIILSTQRPIELTAGKMVTLSIRSFCNVIKASVTYLNLLRTVTADI